MAQSGDTGFPGLILHVKFPCIQLMVYCLQVHVLVFLLEDSTQNPKDQWMLPKRLYFGQHQDA